MDHYLIWLIFGLISLVRCHFYDSVDRLHVLAETEKYYLDEVEKHLEEKQNELENIKR